MSLVSAILKEHAGDLSIESKLGEGTRMIVSFDCTPYEEDEE